MSDPEGTPPYEAPQSTLSKRLKEHLLQSNGWSELACEVERLMQKAFNAGRLSVRVGSCGADSEIHRLDFQEFPEDFDLGA